MNIKRSNYLLHPITPNILQIAYNPIRHRLRGHLPLVGVRTLIAQIRSPHLPIRAKPPIN